jgi:hypothetical protein
MKALGIDFVAEQSSQRIGPRWIWLTAALLCAALAAATAWKIMQLRSEQQAIALTHAALQEKIQSTHAALQQAQPSPTDLKRLRDIGQAAKLLQADLNKPLAALENLKIPGVKLRSMTLDNAQDLLEVEFDLPSLEQVAAVNEALGLGYPINPWQFIATSAQSNSAAVAAQNNPAGSAQSSYVGRWRVKISAL